VLLANSYLSYYRDLEGVDETEATFCSREDVINILRSNRFGYEQCENCKSFYDEGHDEGGDDCSRNLRNMQSNEDLYEMLFPFILGGDTDIIICDHCDGYYSQDDCDDLVGDHIIGYYCSISCCNAAGHDW
jgi:hypothetical protein